jgi:hypothetical protein
VPINSTILQQKIRNYRAYFDYLLTNKIIESDSQYIKGKKSKGYRFVWKHCQAIKQVEVSAKKLSQSEKNGNQLKASVKKTYNHLLKWYSAGLQINYNLAMEYINADLNRKLSSLALQGADIKNNDYKNPWQQYRSAAVNIEKLRWRLLGFLLITMFLDYTQHYLTFIVLLGIVSLSTV